MCIRDRYEMIPGVALNVIVMVAVTLMTKAPSKEITDTFDKATELSKIAIKKDIDFEEAAEVTAK